MKPIELDFSTFQQAVDHAKKIQQTGYQQAGDWDLGQVCEHLAVTMDKTREGLDLQFPWLVKFIARRFMKKKMFQIRRIKPGLKAPKIFCPPEDTDTKTAVEHFEKAAIAFQANNQPLKPHPVFGPMSIRQWKEFHLIHCMHHLVRLIPSQKS